MALLQDIYLSNSRVSLPLGILNKNVIDFLIILFKLTFNDSVWGVWYDMIAFYDIYSQWLTKVRCLNDKRIFFQNAIERNLYCIQLKALTAFDCACLYENCQQALCA